MWFPISFDSSCIRRIEAIRKVMLFFAIKTDRLCIENTRRRFRFHIVRPYTFLNVGRQGPITNTHNKVEFRLRMAQTFYDTYVRAARDMKTLSILLVYEVGLDTLLR
jgi:hypothetical protein